MKYLKKTLQNKNTKYVKYLQFKDDLYSGFIDPITKLPEGYGKHFLVGENETKLQYIGQWKNGIKNGNGILFIDKGGRTFSNFNKNLPNGNTMIFDSNGD